MEYALQFLNITYIIPEEFLKNSKTEKIKYFFLVLVTLVKKPYPVDIAVVNIAINTTIP